jgi:hypothetical protein
LVSGWEQARSLEPVIPAEPLAEPRPQRHESPVVVVSGGVTLRPPRRARDCTCVSCSTFRTQHLVWRAVLTSSTVPLMYAFVLYVWTEADRGSAGSGTAVVGALLLVLTMLIVLAMATWYQPLRRLLHIARPRSHMWPPV